jgi:hypothetical protein
MEVVVALKAALDNANADCNQTLAKVDQHWTLVVLVAMILFNPSLLAPNYIPGIDLSLHLSIIS